MRSGIIFVTGTDTGVGKTLLTCLLLQHLRQKGRQALAIKPFCSGGRDDIEKLHRIQQGELSEKEITPYYFVQPLAPGAAAPGGKRRVRLKEVLAHIEALKARCEILLVEGIGGLMVPLNSRETLADLIRELESRVIVVARNQLGTLNHTLLTVSVLQSIGVRKVRVVLMDQERADLAARSNARILAEKLGPKPIFRVSFMAGDAAEEGLDKKNSVKIKKTLARLLDW